MTYGVLYHSWGIGERINSSKKTNMYHHQGRRFDGSFFFTSRHLTLGRVDTVDTNSECLLSLIILLPVETCLGISILPYLKERYPRYYRLLVSGCTLNRGETSNMKKVFRLI